MDSESIIRFLDKGAQLNVPQQARSSLPAVAAGVRCYIDCCGLIQVTPFPPLPLTLVRWGALFAPWRTLGLYVAHLEKACALLGLGAQRRATAAQAVIAGLANTSPNRAYFARIHSGEYLTRPRRFEQCDTEFSRAANVSFLFLFRL